MTKKSSTDVNSYAKKRSLTLQYYKVPVEVLEDSDLFLIWVEKAISVAKKAKK